MAPQTATRIARGGAMAGYEYLPALRPPALRRSGRFQALLRAVGDALTGITRATGATFSATHLTNALLRSSETIASKTRRAVSSVNGANGRLHGSSRPQQQREAGYPQVRAGATLFKVSSPTAVPSSTFHGALHRSVGSVGNAARRAAKSASCGSSPQCGIARGS